MAQGAIDVGRKLMPKHGLGDPLIHSPELQSNDNMGKGAQGRATVHGLEPGLREKYNRKGRKGRTR